MTDLFAQTLESQCPPHLLPHSKDKILRQWVPSFIRQTLKYLFLPFVLLDYFMHRFARKIIRPPFRQEGGCLKRGACCHYVLIRYSSSLFGRLFYFWYTQILGFYPRLKKLEEYEGKKMYVMGCRYLKKNGSCSQYLLRPLVCRQWPVIEHFGYPRILKGCGYRSNPSYPPHSSDALAEGDSRLKVIQ